MKRTASANGNSKSSTAKRARVIGYLMCIDNSGYPASLEVGKVYRQLGDDRRAPKSVRVIDESGEDYLFDIARFVPVEVPKKGKLALRSRN